MIGVASSPLAWPDGWPRTPVERRDRGDQFRKFTSSGFRDKLITFADARDGLSDELRRLGASSPVVSTNHPTDRYGIPTESKKRIADEGVAVYFQLKGRPMVMASDRYDNAAANMRSLALAIEAMRQLERHGGGTMLERAFNGFVALPPPSAGERHPCDVLGVHPDATQEEIDKAFRDKAKLAHPDVEGGSVEAMQELTMARWRLRGGA